MIAFINNQFVEESKATLGITDLSIQRGYGVFDFFVQVILFLFFLMITLTGFSNLLQYFVYSLCIQEKN